MQKQVAFVRKGMMVTGKVVGNLGAGSAYGRGCKASHHVSSAWLLRVGARVQLPARCRRRRPGGAVRVRRRVVH
jgi:hypothetical protein